jgi:hypothetical protein
MSLEPARMTSVRIFMSFDLDHDQDLHDRLLQESRGRSAFAVANRSEVGAMTDQWSERVRARIAAVDEVVVICGEHTDESPRVTAELAIAREQQKPYMLLWGRRERMCKKPRSARADDGMYSWTPEILQQQISYVLRRSRQPQVPEGMKRQAPTGRS